MAAREIIVKKYVVRLSGEEREQLVALTRKGRGPAQRLMKARILLKADASEAGEGWSDNQIIEALETSASMVCLDETSKQLIAETRAPVQMKKGRPARFDYEYERKGTANLFMMFAPLEGWRHVKVTDRHTAVDYAHALKDLADIHFFNAKKIVLVQDNLNTHTKASLYEAFPAAEARRLAERFEWHYTPKHGSWLDMAESELGVLSSQCLDRRIPDKQTLIDEIAAWEDDRNTNHAKADWQFTTANARIKLKHLYPSI